MSSERVEDEAVASLSDNSGFGSSSGTANANAPASPSAAAVSGSKSKIECAPNDVNNNSDAAGSATDERSIKKSDGGDTKGEAQQPVAGTPNHLDLSGVQRSETEHSEEEEDAAELDTVAANDVKNIILQVLSPYFDDDASGAGDVAGVDGFSGGANTGQNLSGSPNMGTQDRNELQPSASSPSSPNGPEEEGSEDVAQRYDHMKSEIWTARICDGIMERLIGLGKPFKFVVHTMVMRKCGAGLHVCSSCYYAPSDGWLSHSHDLSLHLYAVVTVYWCAM